MTKFDEIKGFAFDLDGVIADTARFHGQAWHQTADEVGRTEAFGGDVEEFIGAEVGIVKVARDFIP